MTKAILFDFWGTLVENGVWSPIKQVKNILQINLPFSEYVIRMEKAMMTKKHASLKESFEAVCEEFNLKCDERRIEEIVGLWNKSWMLAHPYEEVVEVLQKLKEKYQLILVSNTDCISVNQVLDKFQLRELFDKIYLSCEVGKIKTDENFFKQILEDLNLKVEECIVVGDSIQSDIVAAKKIGIKAVLVDRKNKRDFDLKIESLKELELFLDK